MTNTMYMTKADIALELQRTKQRTSKRAAKRLVTLTKAINRNATYMRVV